MSRINTNVTSLLAQRVLRQQNESLNTSLERLSTGLRINRGKDDPAGLIASESLRSEGASITAAIGNAERADQVVNIAEGGLTEVSGLLTNLQSLIGQSANDAGLSLDEKNANQLQIDSILQTIDRIASSTSFQGTKLLNGNFDYTTTGINGSQLTDVKIDSAKIPNGGTLTVTANVVTSAQTGQAFLSAGTGNVLSGTSLTIEVAGNKGLQQFTFASGTTGAQIVAAVNSFKEVTGVSASISTTSGAYVQFSSTEFGSSQFASVTKVAGNSAYDNAINTATATGGSSTAKDTGRDAVVTINGASAQVDGLTATISTGSLALTVSLASAFNTDGGSSSFTITGGGANFQLSPTLDLAGKTSIGIEAVTTGRLGSAKNGHLSDIASGGAANVVTGDVDKGQRIVNDAISQVAKLRGRLGSFQTNTVGATIRSLGVALENNAAAESQIRDTDFASETAQLTRSQILVSAATNVLQLANSTPQSVLQLLR
ncbi:MAG: flagellin [Planctomycetes bacterium]|nr:flagellin [Planctomycetota bacterium]